MDDVDLNNEAPMIDIDFNNSAQSEGGPSEIIDTLREQLKQANQQVELLTKQLEEKDQEVVIEHNFSSFCFEIRCNIYFLSIRLVHDFFFFFN